MTPREALNMIHSSAGDWETMKTAVNQASVAVDLNYLIGREIMALKDINSSFIDDRY